MKRQRDSDRAMERERGREMERETERWSERERHLSLTERATEAVVCPSLL